MHSRSLEGRIVQTPNGVSVLRPKRPQLEHWRILSHPKSYSEVEDRMETVRVIYHHEADGWWAASPDVEGWSAAGDSYAEVVKLAEEGIPLCGMTLGAIDSSLR